MIENIRTHIFVSSFYCKQVYFSFLMGFTSRKRILFIRLALILTLIIILNYLFNSKSHKRFKKHKGPQNRRNKMPRSFYHTRKEIKLTKKFKIQPRKCNNKRTGISIFITTRAKDFARRRLLRKNWVKYARQRGICVYFMIGLTRNKNKRRKNWQKKEAKKYHDIIQGNFIDDYHNLTLKTISMLRWANIHCKKDQFVMKVDDDVLPKIDRFIENRHLFKQGKFIISIGYYWLLKSTLE